MRKFVIVAAWIAVAAIAFFDVGFILGRRIPAEHIVSRTLFLHQVQPAAAWSVISDFAHEPEWRSDLKYVEKLPDQNGNEVWQEHYKMGMAVSLETTAALPPVYLVRTITGNKGSVSGSWKFNIEPVGGGCHVTITERGSIQNPFLRFMMLHVFKYRYIDDYLKALAGKFKQRPYILR